MFATHRINISNMKVLKCPVSFHIVSFFIHSSLWCKLIVLYLHYADFCRPKAAHTKPLQSVTCKYTALCTTRLKTSPVSIVVRHLEVNRLWHSIARYCIPTTWSISVRSVDSQVTPSSTFRDIWLFIQRQSGTSEFL